VVVPSNDATIGLVRRARRSSLPEEITRQLLELIAAGGFPDDRLPPERALCESLGVSRGPLRESLSALQQLGAIETRGKAKIGRPARARMELALSSVAHTEQALATDPIEARSMVEPEVAATAAARASEDALAEIEHCLEVMEHDSGGAAERSAAQDAAFHLAIARATGNRILISVVEALGIASRESRMLSWRIPGGLGSSAKAHRAILDALKAGDSDAAREAMRAHLYEVEQQIRVVLREAEAPAA
jgi:DNA-binding FadR family transcriptional regulator